MITNLPRTLIFASLLTSAAIAQTTPAAKTAVLQVQDAILNTHEGHKAFNDLETKFATRKADLDKKQNDIATLQEQFRKSAATLSDDAQRKMARDIERKTKAWNYEAEATQSEYDQEHADLAQTLARKFHAVVDKYARDNGLAMVVDVGNPQTPAFWWAGSTDITNDVVRAYDAAYPVAVAKGTPDKSDK